MAPDKEWTNSNKEPALDDALALYPKYADVLDIGKPKSLLIVR